MTDREPMEDEKDIRWRISAARRMLHREGCDSNVGGHVSARAEDHEGAFWVTGFEYFDTTVPDRVALLDFDLNPIQGTLAMSPTVNFHARIYHERPDVNGIVHLHSHYVSVLSSVEGRTVGMYNVLSVLFHDDQATYFDDGVKSHLSVVDTLGDKRVVIMKNHGAIVASDSLENATIEAMTLEKAARYHLECEAVGGTEIAEAEVVGGRAMYRKHFLPQMWSANLERLRRSDPDLFSVLSRAEEVEPVMPEPAPDPARRPYRPGEVVLRDAWYGVALASAIRGARPVPRAIDDTPIVLWRDGDGAVRAMEDRCAHRRTPLSAGRTFDGMLQCPYHGWCYDASGSVVKIPSLGPGVAPSSRFGVPAYPVVVRYGIVWLWWGDPDRADRALLPEIPFLDRDAAPPAGGDLRYSAPQELVVENLLDLTHIDIVHGAIFGDPLGGVEELTVEHTDEVIVMRRISRDRRPPQLMRHVMGNPERQDIAQTFYCHVRSGVTFGIAWNTPPGWGICLLMCNTPDTPTTTRVTSAIRVIGAPWLFRKIAPILSTKVVARQDERILRRQTPRYRTDDPRADKSVAADAAGLRYRALRAALAERQAAGDCSYGEGWRGPDAAAAILMDLDRRPDHLAPRPPRSPR